MRLTISGRGRKRTTCRSNGHHDRRQTTRITGHNTRITGLEGETGMDVCIECSKPFRRLKPNQRFCPGGKCRIAYHNREKKGGLMLTERLRWGLRSLADAHDVSENEMACRIIHQVLNPDGRPLDDAEIYGKVD